MMARLPPGGAESHNPLLGTTSVGDSCFWVSETFPKANHVHHNSCITDITSSLQGLTLSIPQQQPPSAVPAVPWKRMLFS